VSRGSSWFVSFRGYLHALLDERTRALQMIEELSALSKQRFVPAVYFALVYAGHLNIEAFWDPIRSDPRFAQLLRRVGIPT
jgi:hypothetical protein